MEIGRSSVGTEEATCDQVRFKKVKIFSAAEVVRRYLSLKTGKDTAAGPVILLWPQAGPVITVKLRWRAPEMSASSIGNKVFTLLPDGSKHNANELARMFDLPQASISRRARKYKKFEYTPWSGVETLPTGYTIGTGLQVFRSRQKARWTSTTLCINRQRLSGLCCLYDVRWLRC